MVYTYVWYFFLTEKIRRVTFMESFQSVPYVHVVKRSTLFEDVIRLYGDDSIAVEYPMSIKFIGEQAVDCGGVSRDMVSGFWEVAYRNICDGSRLLIPAVEPHTDTTAELPSIGRFLSHAYLCTGFLPTRIAYLALAGMLLGSGVKIDASILLEALVDYLSEVDQKVMKEALAISRAKLCCSFPDDVKENLLTILSTLGCRQIPTPGNLTKVLVQIAKYVFLSAPMLAIVEINSGIPDVHKPFWVSKTPEDLYAIYLCLSATPSKVLAMLVEPFFTSRAQGVVYGYLRQLIGNMSMPEVRVFLRFVTGSSVCTSNTIDLTACLAFLVDLQPTPAAIALLPATYSSYPEFEREFQLILSDETFVWVMDAV